MTEPATTLTDFLLAALSAALLFRSLGTGRVGAPLLFGAFAMAALLGGIVHGFLGGEASVLQPVVWWLTVVFTGAAGAGLAAVGLECFGWREARTLLSASVVFTLGVAVYAWSDPRFLVGIIATGVGGAICLAGLARHQWRCPGTGATWVAAGLLLSIAASVMQQRRLSIDPVHFDHNATFHVILIPALWLIYSGARRVATTD